MRILLLHDIGTATGGAEHQMLALRDGLRQRGHEVMLFSSEVRPVSGFPNVADATCFGTDTRLQVLSETFNPSAYFALRRVLRDFKPDVAHVRLFLWQLSPVILPLLAEVPALYQAAMYKSVCPVGTKLLPDGRACTQTAGRVCLREGCLTSRAWGPLMLQLQLWRRWRHVFQMTVVLSEAMKRVFEGDPYAPPDPIVVVPNGIAERPMRPPLSGPPTLAFAGRLVPEKGGEVLLRAFGRVVDAVPEARLIVAGEGPEGASLQALAESLGIAERVRWLGYRPRREMDEHFEAAWVQAVPSQWAEPFGNVTTEAMMRGTAAVVSDTGAQPEIVRHGQTGLVVPHADVDAWAEALTALLGDRQRAEAMGRAGHRRALEHYPMDRCVERFLSLYEQLAEPAAPRAPRP